MEFIIISIISIVLIITLKFVFEYSIKKLKTIAENPELDELTKVYPENIEICKKYLKKLNNEKVKIEENKDAESSLYIAISDKIMIGNLRSSFTRIQTIAHECLHSVQNRKMLIFNFIFSNIYLLYFLVISILAIFQILPLKSMFLTILLILGFVFYTVRIFLENDAMIKARYLAKEYMEEAKISSKEEIQKIVKGFDEINNMAIKCVNYHMFLNIMIKVCIFSIICFMQYIVFVN